MMLIFRTTMDPHFREIRRPDPARNGVVDGSSTWIGHLLFHPAYAPRLNLRADAGDLMLSELREILDCYETVRGGAR